MRLIHTAIAAGGLASMALAASVALAAAPTDVSTGDAKAKVQEAVGNTIIETFPDGRTSDVWLAADGTYTGDGRKHDKSSGHWSVKGTQLCFKQAHPFVFGLGYCTPIPDVGMGQPWQAKAPTGEAITVRVAPGHVVAPEPGKAAG